MNKSFRHPDSSTKMERTKNPSQEIFFDHQLPLNCSTQQAIHPPDADCNNEEKQNQLQTTTTAVELSSAIIVEKQKNPSLVRFL